MAQGSRDWIPPSLSPTSTPECSRTCGERTHTSADLRGAFRCAVARRPVGRGEPSTGAYGVRLPCQLFAGVEEMVSTNSATISSGQFFATSA